MRVPRSLLLELRLKEFDLSPCSQPMAEGNTKASVATWAKPLYMASVKEGC